MLTCGFQAWNDTGIPAIAKSLTSLVASLSVDDATGVINCVCWKKLSNAESSSGNCACHSPLMSLKVAHQRAVSQCLHIKLLPGCIGGPDTLSLGGPETLSPVL